MNIEQATKSLGEMGISQNHINNHITKIKHLQKNGHWSNEIAKDYIMSLKMLHSSKSEQALSELIRDFAQYYRSVRLGSFQHDELIKGFLSYAVESIRDIVPNKDDFTVKASVGQGAWADIPWIAIMHRGITESTQDGYYVVILFAKDLKRVFVSLGLGWNQFSEIFGGKLAKQNAKIRSEMLRDKVAINNQDTAENINLGAATQRGKGYEICNIVARELNIDELSDHLLISVIHSYLDKYEILRKEFGADLFYDLDSDKLLGYDIQDIYKKVKLASVKIDKKVAIKDLIAIADTQPPEKRAIYAKQIIRNKAFADYVKRRANYFCEVCGRRPFKKKDGTPYAEADHIDALYLKGKDHPDNMRCLCALCHRVITYGSKAEVDNLIAAGHYYELTSQRQ